MVLQELENTLTLGDIATTLREARKRKIEFKEQYFPDTSTIRAHCDFYNSLRMDRAMAAFEQDFKASNEQIIEALYQYIILNKSDFPK
jgi:Fe-S-cluster formation regulator IscX/YfhJ